MTNVVKITLAADFISGVTSVPAYIEVDNVGIDLASITADNSKGQTQVLTYTGNWPNTATHEVEIKLNAYSGSSPSGTNLHILGVTIDGVATTTAVPHVLYKIDWFKAQFAIYVAPPVTTHVTLIGYNDGGLADGSGNVANTNYAIPKASNFIASGLDILRVPFKDERQATASGYLNTLLNTVAKPIIAAGKYVIFDRHNFGSVYSPTLGKTEGFASADAPALFLKSWNDWYTAYAAAGLNDDFSVVGLENEPGNSYSDVDAMRLFYQPVITALRNAGYKGYFEVPRQGSQEANAITLAKPFSAVVSDPLNRTLLGVHNYGDASNQGSGDDSSSATAMVSKFTGAIQWMQQKGAAAGFLGLLVSEFGTDNASISVQDFSSVVDLFMASKGAVWAFTAWTADPWLAKNGNYLGTLSAPTANLTKLLTTKSGE